MATLGQIATQIEDKLNHIQPSTLSLAQTEVDIKSDVDAIGTELAALEATMQAGFVALGGGLFAIHEAQKAGAVLLDDEVEQKKTILCWLAKEADLLCRILRGLDSDIELRRDTQKSAVEIAQILSRVNAREKLELDAAAALEVRIGRCCPPPPPRPEPCYDPCPTPRVVHYDPKGQDWKPPTAPQRPGRRQGLHDDQ